MITLFTNLNKATMTAYAGFAFHMVLTPGAIISQTVSRDRDIASA